ncbi:MAG: enoyl-ACP reductase FabI [Phycisphaerales bacterium]
MTLLKDKVGLIVGVANDRSYATHMARSIMSMGGTCCFTHLPGEKNERRTRKAAEGICEELGIDGSSLWLRPLDASDDAQIDAVFNDLGESFARLDFVVHSIAFADREWLQHGKFTPTPRAAYLSAVDISAYTLAALAHRAKPLMERTGAGKEQPGGSILAMSYYGSEKVVPGYNVMGVAKAALECTARYLANELGATGIRVNTISGGPLRTLAASAVGGIDVMLTQTPKFAPLRRNLEGREVGDTAAFLVSDMSSGITGENIYVDCGINIIGAAVESEGDA